MNGSLSPRDVRLWDALALFWVVLWFVLGAVTGIALWRLSYISSAAVESARALDTAAQSLRQLAELPVVGDQSKQLAEGVTSAAADVRSRAQTGERDVRLLAVTVGLAVALVPATPVLAMYLPWRVSQRRLRRDVQSTLSAAPQDDAVRGWLALQAATAWRWRDVAQVAPDPVSDLRHGDVLSLSDAALARLGIAVPEPARERPEPQRDGAPPSRRG